MSVPDSAVPAIDDGVLERVRKRTLWSAAAPAVAGLALAVLGWGLPGWWVGATGAVIGGVVVALCAVGCAALVHRARLWAVAQRRLAAWVSWAEGSTSARPDGWVDATCGEPQPLHRPEAGPLMWRRAQKYPAHVMGLRTASGPLADGKAVFVHARVDRLLPTAGDVLLCHTVSPRGPILLRDPARDVVFVADRWSAASL